MASYRSIHSGPQIDTAVTNSTLVGANPVLSGLESALSSVLIGTTQYKINNVKTIAKTGSSGSSDIYTVTFDDGTTITFTVDVAGGTGDYDSLSNRPQINSVTLTQNKTWSDLGLDYLTNTEIENLLT